MKKAIVGVLLLLVGVFLVFNNLGWVDHMVYRWVISWPSLLVAIGFILLFDKRTSNKEGGAILIVLGLLFLLPRIFDIPSIKHFILPVIIIGLGLLFLVKSTKKKELGGSSSFDELEDAMDSFGEEFNKEWKENWKKSFSSVGEAGENNTKDGAGGFIKREYVFSGSKEKWRYDKVKRIEIETVFSGIELDLSQIEFSEAVGTVHIKITSVFSSVKIFIPSDWNSVVQKTGIFGGFVDNRPPYIKQNNNGQLIILEVEAVFGGGEIRYYE